MRRLLPRALVGGVGLSLLLLGLTSRGVVAVTSAGCGLWLLVSLAVEAAAGWRAGARFAAGMAAASLLAFCYHLELPPRPGAAATTYGVLGATAVLCLLCGIWSKGRWLRMVLRQTASARGAMLLVMFLFAGARWFTWGEFAADPGGVWRGFLPLLTMPLGLLALACAARAVPETWLARLESTLRGFAGKPWRPALLAFGLSAAVCWFAVGPLPHVADGVAYLFGAKCLLAGGLAVPVPQPAGAFELKECWVFQDPDGLMYSVFPPGWPLLLAAGAAVGAAWLVAPAVAGLAVWLVARGGGRHGAWAALLLAASPFVVLQAATHMAHTATLLWIALAAFALGRLRAGRARDAALIGLAVGMCFVTRYLEGLLLGLVVLAMVVRAPRPPWRCWLAGCLAALPGLGLAVADNIAKTGSPTLTPVERFYTLEHGGPVNRPGFGHDRGLEWDHGLGPGHSPREGLWNDNANAWELSRMQFGWACGSLGLAMVGLLWCGRPDATERFWLIYAAGTIAIYTAYWYHGIAFGPRYWHPLVVPVGLLSVRGGRIVLEWLGARREAHRRRLIAFVVCAVASAWTSYVPLELSTAYRNYFGREASDRGVPRAARAAAGGRPAMVVLAQERTAEGVRPDYATGLSLCPPGFRGQVIIARELDAEGQNQVASLREAWPDRVFLTWYKIDGGGWRLAPMPPVEENR